MKSTQKRLRRNKPSSSSQPSSESDPEFVEIVQPDNSGVVGTSAKASHEHAVEIPTAKQHIVSEKTKCWLFFPIPEKGKTCIFVIAIVNAKRNNRVDCKMLFKNKKVLADCATKASLVLTVTRSLQLQHWKRTCSKHIAQMQKWEPHTFWMKLRNCLEVLVVKESWSMPNNRQRTKASSIFIREVPIRMFAWIGHWLTGCPLVAFRTILWMVGLSSISVSKWTQIYPQFLFPQDI